MEPADIYPPVPKKLLIALDQAFPDNHQELIKLVMRGDTEMSEVFFEAGIRSVIQLLHSWHNGHSTLET